MAASKRTQPQRAADLLFIENLALKGRTETEIAYELSLQRPYNISRQQVGYDLRKLARIWNKEAVAHLDKHKARALAEIKHLQREYWNAWERSRENAETEITEYSGAREESGKGRKSKEDVNSMPDRFKKSMRIEGQSGNPAFLKGIEWCINKRCEILGLDAPKTVNVNWKKELEDAGMDPAAVFENMVQAAYSQFDGADNEPDGSGQE